MYVNGQGVPQDFGEALRWLRKAHAQGFEEAAEEIEDVLRKQRQQQGAAAAASPPTSSSSASPLPIGTRVELHGLKTKKLNRQRGVVEGFDADSGRCVVKLEDGRSCKLKVENLAEVRVGRPPEELFEEASNRFMVLHNRYGQGNDEPWRRIKTADDRRENAEVVRMMTEAAEQGNAEAQDYLGTMYLYGNGVPQSDALAVEWWRKAADQGYAQAQCNLGVMYRQGKGGLPQSDALAVEWTRKAADQEYAPAQYGL